MAGMSLVLSALVFGTQQLADERIGGENTSGLIRKLLRKKVTITLVVFSFALHSDQLQNSLYIIQDVRFTKE